MSSIVKDEAREKSEKIVNFYKSVNKNTVLQSLPQSEIDKKQKIRRLKVVVRDEEAVKFTKLIKSEVENRKKEKYKKGKVPASKKETIQKAAAVIPIQKTTKEIPVPQLECEIKLKTNSKIGIAWTMFNDGKTYKEISAKLGVPNSSVRHLIWKRRKQLNIPAPPAKGALNENSIIGKIWSLYKAGMDKDAIATRLKLSRKRIETAVALRKRQYNLVSDRKKIANKIRILKKKGVSVEEIAKKTGRNLKSVKYYYNKQV